MGGPPPPPPELNKVPRTGSKAAAVVPASWLPVAALRIVGAALRSRDVKSGPPLCCGRGLGAGAGRLVVVLVK